MNLGTKEKVSLKDFLSPIRVETKKGDEKEKEQEILQALTEEQGDIIKENEGVFFVAAGPGSGKTRTLIYNIAYLINRGVSPESILAFTFTKKAAIELQERLSGILSKSIAIRINVGTIHSIFLKILKEDYGIHDPELTYFGIATQGPNRVNRLIDESKRRLSKRGVNIVDIKTGDIMRSISLLKSQGTLPDDMELPIENDTEAQSLQLIYEEYESLKRERKVIDFDDMLLLTLILFDNHPDISRFWSTKFRYIFVDEYQDTNWVQTDVLKHLIEVNGNLKAIGDPRQAIYGFRGGVPEIFEGYEKHFPGSILKTLSKNFRCPVNVNDASNVFIRGESNRLKLECISENPVVEIEVLPIAENSIVEAKNIIGNMVDLIEQGTPYRNLCVLYRTNAQSMPLEDQLISHKLPYRIIGSGCFFDRREIRDILSYMRLVDDPHDIEAFSQIYNRPNRWLGKVFLDHVMDEFHENGGDLIAAALNKSTGRYVKGGNELIGHILNMRKTYEKDQNLMDIVLYIRSEIGYDSWFLSNNDTNEDEGLLSNLTELTNTVSRFNVMEKLLAYIDLMRQEYKKNEGKKDVITLMTIHKSKGLEFPVIFLAGLSEGLLPHALADELEERRLTYVAITRTQGFLFLSPLIGKGGISGYIKEIVPKFSLEKEVSNITQINNQQFENGEKNGNGDEKRSF